MVDQHDDLTYEQQIVRGMFKAFLDGKRTLGWAMSTISKKLYGQPLLNLMIELEESYGDLERYQALRQALDKYGWLGSEADNAD